MPQFTVSLWVKPEDLGTMTPATEYRYIFGQEKYFLIAHSLDAGGIHNINAGVATSPSGGVGTLTAFDPGDWIHITVTSDLTNNLLKLYLNGEYKNATSFSTINNNSNSLRFGIERDLPGSAYTPYSGWMDEVRIFSGILTDDQIKRMTYQEIKNNAGNIHGTVIDKDIIDIDTGTPVPWTDLVSYYPMTNIKSGRLIDESGNDNNGFLNNITNIQPQTAPMPYETKFSIDELWTSEDNWLHGDVWDIEDIANNKDWSIVHIHDNITTTASHKHLGLIIDAGKTFTVGDTGLDDQDFEINNTWYLELNGTIDLQDDSQLIQGLK